MNKIKKVFGGINLTWTKLILFAILSGVYTAIVAIIPALHYTSFTTIVATLEVWILLGIIIIMNAKSNIDSALKCFVFFLISQPLIYLIQVPFSWQGWNLFLYYKFWFVITVLCLPMGYIGYYIKKGTWVGYLIVLPMILLTLVSYHSYLTSFTFNYPYYSLISIFCIITSILYPIVLFDNKKIQIVGSMVSGILVVIISVLVYLHPYVYTTQLSNEIDHMTIDDTYEVSLEDAKYGDVYVEYVDTIESYVIHCDFKKRGETNLIVKTPKGEVKTYPLTIYQDYYDLKE